MRLLRLLLLIVVTTVAARGQSKPEYEIYALRYATVPNFPVAELVAGADPARRLDIAMLVWLVRGNGHTILVDSGFYRDHFFKEWQVNDYVKPSDAIGKLGLKPEDVTDVIITHMHWDHADGMDRFPKRASGSRRMNSSTTPARPGSRRTRMAASIPTTC